MEHIVEKVGSVIAAVSVFRCINLTWGGWGNKGMLGGKARVRVHC